MSEDTEVGPGPGLIVFPLGASVSLTAVSPPLPVSISRLIYAPFLFLFQPLSGLPAL